MTQLPPPIEYAGDLPTHERVFRHRVFVASIVTQVMAALCLFIATPLLLIYISIVRDKPNVSWMDFVGPVLAAALVESEFVALFISGIRMRSFRSYRIVLATIVIGGAMTGIVLCLPIAGVFIWLISIITNRDVKSLFTS